jgi:N6-adenosine-specific RNA methylase IME4
MEVALASLELPSKKYQVILADPPWSYQNWSDKAHGAARSWYPCMSVRQISALPVKNLADDNCALFLWTTGPKFVEGTHLPIMWSWGFRPVCVAFTWVKTYADGGPYCGLGFYTRSATEFCILGLKGKMKRLDKNVRQLIQAPVREHSQKPLEIYDRIETLFGQVPRIELFARGPGKAGWDIWGLEAGEEHVNPKRHGIVVESERTEIVSEFVGGTGEVLRRSESVSGSPEEPVHSDSGAGTFTR